VQFLDISIISCISISGEITEMTNNTMQDLCKAIQEHDYSKVRSILAIPADDPSICIDEQNSEGWSALMFAAKYNDVETAQNLIKRK
jgi:ankyrin repeat protein